MGGICRQELAWGFLASCKAREIAGDEMDQLIMISRAFCWICLTKNFSKGIWGGALVKKEVKRFALVGRTTTGSIPICEVKHMPEGVIAE